MKNYDVIIVGGGPAGMAVAYRASQEGAKKILLLERQPRCGGILNQCVHAGFGLHYFKAELTGTEYAARYRQLLAQSKVEVQVSSCVTKLSQTDRVCVTFINTTGEHTVAGRHLVLATGCRERTREMLTIPGTRPAGIFTAGLAQEMINIYGVMPGRNIVIIGSGDIGLIMARRCTLEGARVLAVMEIQPALSGLVRNKVQCLDDFAIPLYLEHEVVEILGKNRVEGIRYVEHPRQEEKQMACDTVLFSVGLIPEQDLLMDAGIEPGEHVHVVGNANIVHALADDVTREAEALGTRLGRDA